MSVKQRIEELRHVIHPLPSGGQVLVLDRGALIDAEEEAMLQALHSRSIGGIESHLKALEKRGAGNMMGTFYVGYGHKSIGDCGHAVVFIEGVSMLAAKAIQDWRLYSGQESSTRYIDFSKQRFADPVDSEVSQQILEMLRSFYLNHMEAVQEMFREKFPYQKEWDETDYEKTIKARAFDVMRGFLPAGATTNLAWSGNLRQMADSITLLRHHSLEEVREIASVLLESLQEFYPNSFGHKKYEATEEYNARWMYEGYYFNPSDHHFPKEGTGRLEHNGINYEMLATYQSFLTNRPQKTELPRQIAECGTVTFRFLLDFASFRDIQRQRAVVQRMPLLTTDWGFNGWYSNNLPEKVRSEVSALMEKLQETLPDVTNDPFVKQYYIPMGFNTPNRVTGDLHALTYLVELRGTRFVHPTLCTIAQEMGNVLKQKFQAYGYNMYLDDNPDAFDVKRGKQDIVKK